MVAGSSAEVSFTEQAWDDIAGWREAVEVMPFIRALSDGTLPAEAFAFYLTQDAAYLTEFSRALSIASAIAPIPAAQAFYASSAHVALEVESTLHRDWLASQPAVDQEVSPVTVAYTNHLLAAGATGSYALVVAAVLPCYWLYAHIADVIVTKAGDLTGHPYARWISTYADPAFQESARTACRFADDAATGADAATRERMLTAFTRSSAYEYLFFDQAINRPRWPTPPGIASR
jgi:hydroxymethylpyrimidine/phosphomethylpyrimidine kinase